MAPATPRVTAADREADTTLLEEALERFRLAESAEDTRRQRQLHDYKFSIGRKNATESYQWDDLSTSMRKGRITLTHNRIGPHIRQVLNQIRQARQSIKVVPVDNGADPEKAEIRQGVFRCIEAKSKALTAYITAADQQLRMGEGFVRVVPEYVKYGGKIGPEQELKIKAIPNRFSVYFDPATKEFDGSDARYVFIIEDLELAEYKKRYGKSDAATRENFRGVGDDARAWFPKGSVRIAEYFYVVTEWANGQPTSQKVYWRKMNGIEWLDRRELPIPFIPVARAIGEMTDVEGEVDYRGVVPDAMDAQKSLNYEESATAEAFGVAPKAPWTGYAASFVGRPEWDDANVKNYSKLGANSHDPQKPELGLLPLPQRTIASPDISAMVIAGQRAENNLRNALGVIDVDASERSREQSGRAIRERRMQNDLSNSHFAENLGLMIQQVGRILDAWVAAIYDAPRVMEITGADDRRQKVMVYAGAQMAPPEQPKDVDGVYDLSVGRYDIEIDIGPSYLTQRKEAVEMMTEVVTAAPALLDVMGDLYFGNMDWAAARQIGERFKKRLPKELQDAEPGEPAPLPPEVQQEMAAMQQQHQLLVQELQAKTEEVERQTAKAQADLQAKQAQIQSAKTIKLAEIDSEEKIAAAKLDQELRIAELKLKTERAIAAMKIAHADAQHDDDLMMGLAEGHADREHARTMQQEKPMPMGAE